MPVNLARFFVNPKKNKNKTESIDLICQIFGSELTIFESKDITMPCRSDRCSLLTTLNKLGESQSKENNAINFPFSEE
ncbi:10235_t:CDS:1, partial [Gigaspora rosea]